MSPIMILPATCELCGNWLPEHSVCLSKVFIINRHLHEFCRLAVLAMGYILVNGASVSMR